MKRTISWEVLAALTVGATMLTGVSHAAMFPFHATLSGENEVPPADTPAMGTAEGTYDDVANTFSFSWQITDNLVGEPAAPGAHIHRGAAGTNGPIIFFISDGEWPLSGSDVWSDLTQEDVNDLFAGNLYFNFHTTAFPGGEVRGQIILVPSPGPAGVAALFAGLAMTMRRRS